MSAKRGTQYGHGYDEGWFPEPFGVDYERPPGAPCPGCECCTLPLCERAKASGLTCTWHADANDKEIVSGCPCSGGASTLSAATAAGKDGKR